MKSSALTKGKDNRSSSWLSTGSAKTIPFSRIFGDKKSLVLFFPADIDKTFRLVEHTIKWAPHFQSMSFVFNEFQQNLYKDLIREPKISILSVADYEPDQETDLYLILTNDNKLRKKLAPLKSKAIIGYGKNVNVRFVPPPGDHFELCRKITELLNLETDVKDENENLLVSKSFLDEYHVSEFKSVFDVNSIYSKYRISKLIRMLKPPYECLLTKTGSSVKKNFLKSTLIDSRLATTKSIRIDLSELVKYSLQAKTIVTDNKALFELLLNFHLNNRLLFCGKGTTFGNLISFMQQRNRVN